MIEEQPLTRRRRPSIAPTFAGVPHLRMKMAVLGRASQAVRHRSVELRATVWCLIAAGIRRNEQVIQSLCPYYSKRPFRT